MKKIVALSLIAAASLSLAACQNKETTVENNATVGGAVAGDAVPATSNGKLVPALARSRHDTLHIRDAFDAHDRVRSFADVAIENRPGLVVAGVVRCNDLAPDVVEAFWRCSVD